MDKFHELDGMVAPLDRSNVDTDAIIPSRFLKSVKRSGFGVNLFDGWRYLDAAESGADNSTRRLNPDFVLNQPRYRGAQILLARENFGCGSSREHAAWALLDFGIRAVVAPSYADIFVGNCFKNGLLPVVLDPSVVDALFQAVAATPGYRLKVNLERQTVAAPDGAAFSFEVEAFHKFRLLNGLDDVGLVLRRAKEIKTYEEKRHELEPWLFANG